MRCISKYCYISFLIYIYFFTQIKFLLSPTEKFFRKMVSLKSFTVLSAPRSFMCCLWPQRCWWQPDSMMMFFPSRIFCERLSLPWPGRRTGRPGLQSYWGQCHAVTFKKEVVEVRECKHDETSGGQKIWKTEAGHDVVGIKSALKVFIGVQHVVWLLVFPSAIALAKWFVERLARCVSPCGQDTSDVAIRNSLLARTAEIRLTGKCGRQTYNQTKIKVSAQSPFF